MDQITLLFAAMLASLQQLPSHSLVPAASTPPPVVAQAVQKKLAPPHNAKSEHACPDFGRPDVHGNLNYCFNNN